MSVTTGPLSSVARPQAWSVTILPRRAGSWQAPLAALALLSGCNSILGFDAGEPAPVGSSTGTGGGTAGSGGGGAIGGQGGAAGSGAQPSLAWIAQLSGSGDDFMGGLAFDATGAIGACGHFGQDVAYEMDGTASQTLQSLGGPDIFALRLEPDGALLWLEHFGAAQQQYCTGLAFNGAGAAQLTGSLQGPVSFGPHSLDGGAALTAYVTRIGPAGGVSMAHQLEADAEQVSHDVAVGPDNRVWFTGAFRSTVAFAGKSFTTGAAVDAGFVASVDAYGVEELGALGAEGADDATFQFAVAVEPRTATEILVVGGNSGTLTAPTSQAVATADVDPFLAEFDDQATLTRVRGFASAGYSSAQAVTSAEGGAVVLAGFFTTDLHLDEDLILTSSQGGRDGYLAKLAADWSPIWALGFGGSGDQEFRAVELDAAGNVYALVMTTGPMQIGNHTVLPEGMSAGVLSALDPNGEHWFHVTFQSAGAVRAERLAYDPVRSRLAVAGNFEQHLTVMIDGTAEIATLSSADASDGYLVVLDLPAGP